jgi:hypothetical protein
LKTNLFTEVVLDRCQLLVSILTAFNEKRFNQWNGHQLKVEVEAKNPATASF